MPQEVYPNPPVVLTACEVRVPPTGLPVSNDQIQALREQLREVLPILTVQPLQQVTLQVSEGRPQPPTFDSARLVLLSNRERTFLVQVAADSVVVKTADYRGWDEFRPILARVIRATRDTFDPDGYVRIGLRYIDEIRLPDGGDDVHEWDGYLADDLLTPSTLSGADQALRTTGWEAVTQFEAGPGHTVIVRYGPKVGYAVNPADQPRRVRLPPAGPYFLFDVDSYWETSGGVPEFNPDELTERCDDLHRPVRSLFDRAITDALRDQVLRKAPA